MLWAIGQWHTPSAGHIPPAPPLPSTGNAMRLIERTLFFTVPGFDVLKLWQRHLSDQQRRNVTNAEALDHILGLIGRPMEP